MKKEYTTPVAEKIDFDYSKQVVASGGSGCSLVPVSTGQQNLQAGFDCVSSYKYIF